VTAASNLARAHTGRHNSHHHMSQGLKDCIKSVVVKFLAAAEDHHVPQERVASRWLNFGEGVTWRILLEQVLAEYQPAFGVQSSALGGYLWGNHKTATRPTAAAYEALNGRVRGAERPSARGDQLPELRERHSADVELCRIRGRTAMCGGV